MNNQEEKRNNILNEAQMLVSKLEPLFFVTLQTANRHDLDTIQISRARAREIHHDLSVLKRKLKSLVNNKNAITMTTDRHLDSIFNL
jgi:hypothetical protein